MRTARVAVVLLAVLAGALNAQELAPPSGVTGRRIALEPYGRAATIRGELLSASGDSAWVLAAGARVVAVPLGGVRSADVRRHGLTAGKGLVWGLVVGTISGIGLTAACSQVEDGCGVVLVGAVTGGLLYGALAALSLGPSSRWHFEPVSAEQLAPYARFPQGPPPGMRDSLAVGSPAGAARP